MSQRNVPSTPRVISPSPTPSESQDKDGYFGPTTRASAKKRASKSAKYDEGLDSENDSNGDWDRARARSRSPVALRRSSGISKSQAASSNAKLTSLAEETDSKGSNGHLSPASAGKGWSWRDLSRSPSPLGLIPIHRQWRSFVHRHEVPRKALHVSIGFFTLWLYIIGVQTNNVAPYLFGALVPIASTDFLRHRFPAINRFYVRMLGAFMRETEVDGYNGVIWYLLGVWLILISLPKDVSTMGILLLSWCDTAASTIGRAYGRYTPRIRKGKSLAGSLGAFAVGVASAAWFWGWLAPRVGPFPDDVKWPFMFKGVLQLPGALRDTFGLTAAQSTITGGWALTIMSVWTGLAASGSEMVDLFGWDDNLTIPVLSGIAIWGFLKVFG